MRVPSRQPALSTAVVFVLVLILIALAALQIHWTDQVSHADRDRLRANLDTAVSRFQRDFYLQLLRICWAFRVPETGPETAVLTAYSDRYDDWRNASAYPAIIADLFVWDAPRGRLLRLNPISEKFGPAQWPPEFAGLRSRLHRVRSAALSEDSPGPRWILDEQSHTLIHPFQIPSDRRSRCAIVQLSSNFLWHRLAPELTARYFGPSASSRYTVAVIDREHPVTALYRSSPSIAGRTPATGDIVANLVPQPETDAFDPVMDRERNGRRYFPLARLASPGQQWKLVVWGSSGSVESAVRALHRRNLVVSFGVLLLLAVALSLVVVSAQSAHRLARAQIDFVAGVSHELRTPLTVICSAADNLADGMLAGSERVREYGSLIRDQGRRLSHIVNEVLSFAAGQGGRRVYRREPLDVAAVIDTAVANVRSEIQSQNVMVEKDIEKDLPRVVGDPSALTECIQNLVSNAIRYGGEARWLRIRALRQHARRKEQVVISVEDRGIGIPARDLPHVFEPFYRGVNATEAQIHGTGLGLALAQKIARAMRGRLTVKSTMGKGSQFTLSLPVERKA
ncbi:MAG: sensor histidine kinase [Bryobacteraceae bacterium]